MDGVLLKFLFNFHTRKDQHCNLVIFRKFSKRIKILVRSWTNSIIVVVIFIKNFKSF